MCVMGEGRSGDVRMRIVLKGLHIRKTSVLDWEKLREVGEGCE